MLSSTVDNLANSPLQKLSAPFLDKAGVTLYVKRDDLIHPQFGGNKWRKLKYNLQQAKSDNLDTILTFGGAWSNHIYATAAAGKHFGFNTIGLIRGEQHEPLNPTLTFAKECGMQLHYISRQEYKQKNESNYQTKIRKKFGPVYLLPEGGSNNLALQGCKEIIQEIKQPFDIICCASGTGATLAGLVSAIRDDKKASNKKLAIGFSALKGGDFLATEVNNFLNSDLTENSTHTDWKIESKFHFGGYAKANEELLQFIRDFKSEFNIELDAVYTGKMFYGLFKLIKSNKFSPGSVIIAIHSGGLQGNKGFNL